MVFSFQLNINKLKIYNKVSKEREEEKMSNKNIHERTINFHARNKNLSIHLQEHLVFEMLLGRSVKYEEALVLSEENHLTKDKAEKILKEYYKRSMNDLRIRIETVLPVSEKKICEVGEVWYLKDPIFKTKTPIYFTGGAFNEYFKDTECRTAAGEQIYFSRRDYQDYESSLSNFLNPLDDVYTISEMISKVELMNRNYGCSDLNLLNMCLENDSNTESILEMLCGEEIEEFLRHHHSLEMAY